MMQSIAPENVLGGPICPLDLNAPGALEDLLSFHRDLTGGFRMDAGDDDDTGDDDDGDKDAEDDDEDGDGEAAEDEGNGDKVSRNQYDRMKRRMIAADKAKSTAVKKLQELEDAKKDKATKADEKATRLEKDLEKATATARDLRLHNAFLIDNKYDWHNPRRALRLLDLSDVEIDEDGKVEGLDEAIEALAKSDPYLLKTQPEDKGKGKNRGNDSDSDSEDDDDESEEEDRSTGSASAGRKKGKKGLDRQAMAQRFPALAGR